MPKTYTIVLPNPLTTVRYYTDRIADTIQELKELTGHGPDITTLAIPAESRYVVRELQDRLEAYSMLLNSAVSELEMEDNRSFWQKLFRK